MKMLLQAGEITQSRKYLSYKCEDLSLNFQNPHKAAYGNGIPELLQQDGRFVDQIDWHT